MSAGAVRAAATVFLLGVLVVWLVRPLGNACPDADRLPAGATSSSAPSFAPPLTRTCTYTTAEGTRARTRYVPLLDWGVLALVAGLAGGAVSVLGGSGSGSGGGGDGGVPRRTPRQRPPAAEPTAAEPTAAERDAAERVRARREREARRRG